MKQKLIYIGANSDEEMEEQFDECIELLEDRRGSSLNRDFRAAHLRQHKHKSVTRIRGGDKHHTVRIISNRGDIDRPGSKKYAIEWVEDIVDDGAADEIIMSSPSRSLSDAQIIHDLTQEHVTVTFASQRISFRAGVDLEDIHRVLATIRNTKTTRDGDEILLEEWPGGRPPIGTEVVRGKLVKGDDYHSIRNTLQRVAFGELTKSEAMRQIGCARKTIGNTLRDRADLYDLPQQ